MDHLSSAHGSIRAANESLTNKLGTKRGKTRSAIRSTDRFTTRATKVSSNHAASEQLRELIMTTRNATRTN